MLAAAAPGTHVATASRVSYASSRIVRRDLARFNASCGQEPTATVLASLRKQYESLDRVLVVDASQARRGVNGVGNLFGDYVLWFAIAIATQRAVFIHWSTPNSPNTKLDRFDLSVFFTGATGGLDWAWTPRTEARVGRRWRSGPHKWLELESKASCAALWRPLADRRWPYVRLMISGLHAIAMAPVCERLHNSTADLAFSSFHREVRASGGVVASAVGVRRAAARAAALREEYAESLPFGKLVELGVGLHVTGLLLRRGLLTAAASFVPYSHRRSLLRGRANKAVPSHWCRMPQLASLASWAQRAGHLALRTGHEPLSCASSPWYQHRRPRCRYGRRPPPLAERYLTC